MVVGQLQPFACVQQAKHSIFFKVFEDIGLSLDQQL